MLAADSRFSDNGVHCTSGKKVFRLKNGAILGLAGDADFRDMVALVGATTPGKMPSRSALAELKMSCFGVVVFPKGQVFLIESDHYEYDHEGEWGGQVVPIWDPFVAVGCGAQFAYGAMEVGASPVQAVRAACRRDGACALPVQYESLEMKKALKT